MNLRKMQSLFVSSLFLSLSAVGQTADAHPLAATAPTLVPALVPYAGTVPDFSGGVGDVGITFLIYKDAQGGQPLWVETQTVAVDAAGRYQVHLGAGSPSGLPGDLFASGEARWLEVQIAGRKPEARVLLASVPYAMKAGDAATLGGLPVSAFALAGAKGLGTGAVAADGARPDVTSDVTTTGGTSGYLPQFDSATSVVNSPVFVKNRNVGIGTVNPFADFHVIGKSIFQGKISMLPTGVANATSGAASQPLAFYAGAYNSNTKSSVTPYVVLQSEPAGSNTPSPSATLNLLSSNGTAAPAETGLLFNANGTIHFAPGQTFPGTGAGNGTITGVTAGTALTGGGTTGSVTLNLDTTRVPLLAANNGFVGNQAITGNLTASGTVSAGIMNATTAFDLGGSLFAVGSRATQSVYLGFAGNSSSTGIDNTAAGFRALSANTTGSTNTANGDLALALNTTGSGNTASGFSTLFVNSTGNNNTATGTDSLISNSTGSGNTATGINALFSNRTGGGNTATGASALAFNTTGDANTASGGLALLNNTSGYLNTASGYETLYKNTTGYYNTASGASALGSNLTGNSNTAEGFYSLYANTTGGWNTASGVEALYYNTSGAYNTASGWYALMGNTTGNDNTAVGVGTLDRNTTGSANFASGVAALTWNTTGSDNVGIGDNSGLTVDDSDGTGSSNTALGSNTAFGTGSIANATAVGANAEVDQSNTMVLGCIAGKNNCAISVSVGIGTTTPDNLLTVNGSADKPGGGSWGTYSDVRLKTLNGSFGSGLGQVMRLRPIRYRYKPDNALGIRDANEHIGVVAQEVKRVIPEAVTENGKGYLLVNNDPILWSMVNAIQEQQKEIAEQRREIAAQRRLIRAQSEAMKGLTAEVRETRKAIRQVKAREGTTAPVTLVAAKQALTGL